MKETHLFFPIARRGCLTPFPFFLFLWLCCFFSPAGFAAAPKLFALENLSLAAEHESLVLNCSVSVDDEDGLRDLLKDGAILELTVDLVMERNRSWWLNADSVERVYVFALRHDPLSRNFLASVPGDTTRVLRDKNLTRLLHATWRQLKLQVLPMRMLGSQGTENTYSLTATFRLQHTEVPPWLEKSLVFWSSDVVPQETRTLEYPH